MGKRSRKSSRRNRRTRKSQRKSMKGGGFGFTGASSIPGTPGIVSNPQVFTAIGDCRATEPGYWIPQSSYGTYEKGLPGMNGGKRRKTNRKQKQRGGRYTFDLSPSSVNGVAPNAAAWWAGTYPPVQRIACEGSTPNPLNPGPHTPSTQPLPVASANLHLNPQSGGGTSPGTVGVGNVDSMYYYAPTAGYDNKPSTWVDSVGAPVQLQIPYAAREWNPACLTTGHPPPLTGALQKGGSLWNTLKNMSKKATNAVGITKKNNSNLSRIGSVYNTVNTLNTVPKTNIVNAVNTSNYPALPASPMGSNTNSINMYTNSNSNFNRNSNYSNHSNNNVNYGFENSVGGKRKKRASKKSRKGRKGRKH
jgi:hypothetical protein